MKLVVVVFCALTTMLLCSVVVVTHQESPKDLLVGTWEEVAWEYEKINAWNLNQAMSDAQKTEICANRNIHEAEVWDFDTNKSLTIYQEGYPIETLKWNIKGRGNILEIVHDGQRAEDYQVQEINADSLVVHFSFDLQIKGIMKMTFKRISKEQYAQKI